MGATKFERYSNDILLITDFFKAFSHPARIQALLKIAKAAKKGATQTELVKELGLAQSTVSQHLKVLRDAGVVSSMVVTSKYNRSFISYKICAEVLRDMDKLIQHYFTAAEFREDVTFKGIYIRYSKIKEIFNWSKVLSYST